MRALVLAGGGMRGAFTSGVLDQIAEAGLPFDRVYGTSAGGGNAAWYAAGQTKECIRSWAYANDPRILNYRRFLMRKGPILDLDALLYDVYPHELGFDEAAVRRAKHTTIVTVTDVYTGRTHYLDLAHVPILPALRATSALPLATSGPVEIDGNHYLDGGLTSPIPVAKALEDGATDIVVVLNKHGSERKPEPRALSWYFGRQYPALASAGRDHHTIINDALRLAENPPQGARVRILRPSTDTGLSRFTRDMDQLTAAIEQGRRDAHRFFA